jgi:hypothetical protein
MLSAKEIMEYVHDTRTMSVEVHFNHSDAKRIGDSLGVQWDSFDVEQFAAGLNVELEHGTKDPATDLTHDDPIATGKIALAHLKEIPDYYTRLIVMEREAERIRSTVRQGGL